jgi:tRNA dimethylallyltransferase
MITALAILGPTASGKSRLGTSLAARLGGEILSIDSRQAYRRLDIGTAKPTAEERRAVPHHLIDILDLDEKPNAEAFSRMALAAIRDVASRGKLPILVGGSGLYFRAVSRGLFEIDLDQVDRLSFAESLRGAGNDVLYARLLAADPESAGRIHPNDRYRIIRALEVFALTGIPLSRHLRGPQSDSGRREIRFVKIGLDLPRAVLHRNIEVRTREMLDRGWVAEVERLLGEGVDAECPGLRTLGYPQIVAHVRGEVSLPETSARIIELTRQYAKRQVTWFKKEPEVGWIGAGDSAALESVERLVGPPGGGQRG